MRNEAVVYRLLKNIQGWSNTIEFEAWEALLEVNGAEINLERWSDLGKDINTAVGEIFKILDGDAKWQS